MQFMLMMFGDAGTMRESQSPDWIREMLGFMRQLDRDLRMSGELIYELGLADGGTAKTVRRERDGFVASDGQVAAPGSSLIGFGVVDVAGEERATEIAASIAEYAGGVEVRAVPEAPPEM